MSAKEKKRLDGKCKLIRLPLRLEKELSAFCAQRGIKNESECIRQAVASYIDSSWQDETLKLSALKKLEADIGQTRDMIDILFKYIINMHTNILVYHAEIDDSLKEAALQSAERRCEKFFAHFKGALRDDPAFFERILHGYFTGEDDGQN